MASALPPVDGDVVPEIAGWDQLRSLIALALAKQLRPTSARSVGSSKYSVVLFGDPVPPDTDKHVDAGQAEAESAQVNSASTARSTSDSSVAQSDTEIRISLIPFAVVPLK